METGWREESIYMWVLRQQMVASQICMFELFGCLTWLGSEGESDVAC